MERMFSMCERTARASLEAMSRYIKDYSKGNRTQEELDLFFEKVLCILSSNVSYMTLHEVEIDKASSYNVFSELEIKNILHKNEGFLKFIYKIREIIITRRELSKETNTPLSIRDAIATVLFRLYSINYINEAKILAKLLFELEVIGGVQIDSEEVIRRPNINSSKQLV